MIRFIFYLAFGYIIMKLVRVFIDPFFETKTVPNTNTSTNNYTPKSDEKKSTLGEYVEYEEVK